MIKDQYHTKPSLIDISKLMCNFELPILSGIHNCAFGPGAEISLHSHCSIARNNSTIGFPEIKMGILPSK